MDGIDFYITDAFGEGMYDSCKDVKFGTMNSRALEFIGAGAQNFKGKLILLLGLYPQPFPTKHIYIYIYCYFFSCDALSYNMSVLCGFESLLVVPSILLLLFLMLNL